MYLLQHVEQHLGPLDTWPTYIIRYLFVDFPSPPIVKGLSAFFSGNNVPVYIASQLYLACNDTCNIHATNYMYQLYLRWQRCMYRFHMFEYYNVLKRKYIWTNGKAFNQKEEVSSIMRTPQLGIVNTGCNNLIRHKLRSVRQVLLCE